MKRTIITLLALLSLSVMVPAAYAQEYIPEVSTLSELQQAIAEAEPGDTIRLLQTIDVDTPVTIGIDGKPLTLCAAEGVQTYLRFVGDWGTASYCELYDLSIDGDNYFPYDSLVTIDTPYAVYMTRLNFANGISDNVGGAVRIDRGQVYAASCTFKNCSATRGGAVYAPVGTSFCPSECGFIENSASFDGGAIYCEGSGEIKGCTFTGNYAVNGSGGAVYAGNSVLIDRGTISGNTALYGGGVYVLDNGKVQNCKLYQNTGTFGGDDLSAAGSVSISADDYSALFSEELTVGGYDALGWFPDAEGSRYNAENPPEPVSSTDKLSGVALKFVLYKKPAPEPEPEPTPAPSPEPSKPSSGGHSHSHTPKPEVKPEPATEPSTPLLKCGKAVIDKANVVDMISYVKRFVPAQERLTRGKFAALLYGLLSSESKVDCDKIAENCFDDLYGSPYESAVSALTGTGAFCGGCGGTFDAEGVVSYGQFLTALTRFVEPEKGYIGSFNVLNHWAAPAAIKAASAGWIDDVPIDLNAPATYGTFVNLLTKIFAL